MLRLPLAPLTRSVLPVATRMAPQTRTIMKTAPKRKEVAPGYAVDPTVGPMLQYERSLPRLPVPTLESTAAKYLESVEPLLTPQEFQETQKAVHSFVTSDLGTELQQRLLARAAEPGRASWISDWWSDAAYMGYRDPVVVFVRLVCSHSAKVRH